MTEQKLHLPDSTAMLTSWLAGIKHQHYILQSYLMYPSTLLCPLSWSSIRYVLWEEEMK